MRDNFTCLQTLAIPCTVIRVWKSYTDDRSWDFIKGGSFLDYLSFGIYEITMGLVLHSLFRWKIQRCLYKSFFHISISTIKSCSSIPYQCVRA